MQYNLSAAQLTSSVYINIRHIYASKRVCISALHSSCPADTCVGGHQLGTLETNAIELYTLRRLRERTLS